LVIASGSCSKAKCPGDQLTGAFCICTGHNSGNHINSSQKRQLAVAGMEHQGYFGAIVSKMERK
jgi:hypothetical protein